TISATAGGIFTGLANLTFDDGTHGTYNVDFPDGINPRDGSVRNMTYNGFDPATFGGAGIQYVGTFGLGTTPGKIVYLGIPFETLYPASTRDTVMARILEFFDAPTGIGDVAKNNLPGDFELMQNFPNPFNPSTTISFRLANHSSLQVQLKIYDILGREMVTLLNEKLTTGKYDVIWDGRNSQGERVSSGIYIYRLQVGEQAKIRKMTLVR
ncbi:MAG: T9SS type A sorting domain-containing protein, partial [Calditrichia bacterium]